MDNNYYTDIEKKFLNITADVVLGKNLPENRIAIKGIINSLNETMDNEGYDDEAELSNLVMIAYKFYRLLYG